jgi:hypothetical protein
MSESNEVRTLTGKGETIPLAAHRIRFTLRTTKPLRFHAFKGSALRGALASTMQRHLCPQWQAERTDPLHIALCPVCQLLRLEHGDGLSGEVRRPYALTPPLDACTVYPAGEMWTLDLTLFGAKIAYLPYLALAIHQMGQEGVGLRDEDGQRGRFAVERIDAVHPLRGERRTMMAPGERTVRSQTLPVTHDDVIAESRRLADALRKNGNRLRITFLTPTRINQGQHMLKRPEFFPLCKQIALRVLDLCAQHGDGRPNVALKTDLYPPMDAVRLVADDTRWHDVKGYSQRLGQAQVLGGLVGSAVYAAQEWEALLPWLVWGQQTHVGKNSVKGCGVYRLDASLDATV